MFALMKFVYFASAPEMSNSRIAGPRAGTFLVAFRDGAVAVV